MTSGKLRHSRRGGRPSLPKILILFVVFSKSVTECPVSCTCTSNGRYVNCEKLFMDYLPVQISSTVFKLQYSYNSLQNVPSTRLSTFAVLSILDLSYNRLTYLPNNSFSENHNLRNLNLKNNYIDNVAVHAFNGLESLVVLDLTDNDLTSLPESVFEPLANRQGTIKLRENRWQCNCEMRDFLNWFHVHMNDVIWGLTNSDQPVCQSPAHLNRRRLADVYLSERNCSGITTTTEYYLSTTEISKIFTSTDDTTSLSYKNGNTLMSLTNENQQTSHVTIAFAQAVLAVSSNLDKQFLIFVAMVTVVVLFVIIFMIFAVVVCKMVSRQNSVNVPPVNGIEVNAFSHATDEFLTTKMGNDDYDFIPEASADVPRPYISMEESACSGEVTAHGGNIRGTYCWEIKESSSPTSEDGYAYPSLSDSERGTSSTDETHNEYSEGIGDMQNMGTSAGDNSPLSQIPGEQHVSNPTYLSPEVSNEYQSSIYQWSR